METLKQRLLEHIADLLDEPTFDISMRIQDCVDPLPNDQSELHLLMTDAAFKVFCNYFGKEDTTKQCAINGVVKSLPTETDDFLNYIKETCITDCNDWHSLLHNKQFESNNDLYKQYIKDKK